jgi:hypothetical protein
MMAPFTDSSDLFIAVHEDGLNLIARHVMRQRPSLFNYATSDIAGDAALWCVPVEVTPEVTASLSPTFTVEQPLPVFGTISPPAALNWSGQLVRLRLDVHKGNVVHLPAELNPPLAAQHFALEAVLVGQLDCPGPDQLRMAEPDTNKQREGEFPPVVLPPTREPHCFELGVLAVGHVGIEAIDGKPTVVAKIDDVDIVGLGGERLEDAISCYIKTTLNLVLFQRLGIAVSRFLLHIDVFGGSISTALATSVPNNPALQDDRIELFVNLGFS